jgi:hypothetical protein
MALIPAIKEQWFLSQNYELKVAKHAKIQIYDFLTELQFLRV